MISKIISGGQTGGDKGGLIAGRQLGLETGGHCPRGWKTELGPDHSLKDFGLICTKSDKYPPRTATNVRNSDGTVGFGNQGSAGMKLTRRLCHDFDKPYFEVLLNNTDYIPSFIEWLTINEIDILNVAGNRESKQKGIQKFTTEFLVEAIECYKKKN